LSWALSGFKAGSAVALEQLGQIARDGGDPAKARDYYSRSRSIRKAIGDKAGMARTLHQMGELALAGEDYGAARKYYSQSRDINQTLGVQSRVAEDLSQLARVAVKQGDRDEASHLENQAKEITGRVKLKDRLVAVLAEQPSETALRAVCQRLDLKYEELPGEGPAVKGRELVTWAYQHDQLERLRTLVREQYPGVSV